MNIIKLDDFPLNPVSGQIYEIIPDKTKIVASTNRLFNKYPTRYISAVPRFAINAYSKPGDYILDPFCGSGTTAIEAMLLGRNAVSIDIDPFARLLISVKTAKYSEEDISILDGIVGKLSKMNPTEIAIEEVPAIPNIEKWFCDKSILWLSNFKREIKILCKGNVKIQNYLYVVLAGIIRKVSNADEVSPKPYVSTKYPKIPADAYELFFKTESIYREAIIDFSSVTEKFENESIILESNDARAVDGDYKIDLAVTSPPYINAYDYVRSLRFEDVWLDLADEDQLRQNRKSYIGTENAGAFHKSLEYTSHSTTLGPIVDKIRDVDAKRASVVETYFEDMAINMISVREKLKKGGVYAIVVGDSKIRNQDIPTGKILAEIAEKNGYTFELSFKYVIRDRYLHLPRGNRGGIIKYDEIVVLRKV